MNKLILIICFSIYNIYANSLVDSLIDNLEVKDTTINFDPNDPEGKGDFSECSQRFFDYFAKSDYIKQFNKISTENWPKNWNKYYSKLIDLSYQKGYDTLTIHTIISKIKPPDSSKIAELPIAIYFTQRYFSKYLIILVSWEIEKILKKENDNVSRSKYLTLGHIKGYIYNLKTQEQTCFMTCE
jgi:hypothetical protein